MYPARVLLADDHPLVLECLEKLLEHSCHIVAKVEDGHALLETAYATEPDIIVLHISMPSLNGLDAARVLSRTLPRTKLIFLTMHADPIYAVEAFQSGGSGYVLKRSAASELSEAIQAVLQGRVYVTPLLARKPDVGPVRWEKGQQASKPGTLTTRQREVLALIGEGKSAKEIARLLSISVKTVEFHKSQMMDALGLRTTADLTRYAVAHGIAKG
ncbi:MAG: DNA-binding response regulator [Nitrospirae bacterium]|nr:MAG: DNA-binding response regulator [Nitrospirota bacterium]